MNAQIRRVIAFFRPTLMLACVVAAFLLPLEMGYRFFFWSFNVAFDSDTLQELAEMRTVFLGAASLLSAFLYGLHHATAHHPFYRYHYRKWLAMTPYDGTQPLPLGPVRLGPRDIVNLALFATVAVIGEPWDGELGWLWLSVLCLVFLLFLWPYLNLVAFSLRFIGEAWTCYALLLGVGLAAALIVVFPVATVGLAIALPVVAAWGLHRALKRFPWELPEPPEIPQLHGGSMAAANQFIIEVALAIVCNINMLLLGTPTRNPGNPYLTLVDSAPSRGDGMSGSRVGWAWDSLNPGPPVPQGRRADGVVFCLLVGLYFCPFCLEDYGDEARHVARAALWFVLGFSAATRLGSFVQGHAPPISLFGRVATGRFIIPGYDRVFAGPFAAAALGVLGPLIAPRLGLPANWDIPIFATLAFLALLNVGPSKRDWQLTAPCRITPGGASRAGLRRI